MASETEPAKLLLPYLQRADELQKHEHLVAYYCRLYAMERGLRIPQNERTKTTNSLLISLMNQLEKDKKSLQLGPEDNLHVEGFALNVFGKADKQDRAGRADLNTAKTFYAASIFFEVLNQFGVLQPDLEQKQKYAAWKAADIRKALKEGRRPDPGPPSGEDDLSIPSSGTYDVGPGESSSINSRPEPDPSQFRDSVHDQHSTNIPPPPPPAKFYDNVNDQLSTNTPPPAFQYRDQANDHQSSSAPQPHFHDEANNQHFMNLPSVPQTYPTAGYPSHDYPPTPGNGPETSDYPQPYNHQPYGQEPNQHLPHNYAPESTSYSLPHFQSYPSFSESSLPAVPPTYPSYFQGSDSNYAPQPSSSTTTHKPVSQFLSSSGINRSVSDPTPAPALAPAPAQVVSYEYDCNYQPPPEKLAEAQKAARFAVGALAFDDVSVAVDYLRKSLELLTNPSAKAGQQTR